MMSLFPRLSSDSGILFEPTKPRESCQAVSADDPHRLNQQTAPQLSTAGLAQINAHGKVELIWKGRKEESLFERGGQNIQRKQVTAGDVFEREQNENKCRNLEDPKGEHGHGVGDKKLKHCGHGS